MLTVMRDHPHSTSTRRSVRYVGTFSFPFKRTCCPLCRTTLTPLQPSMLTVMPPTSLLSNPPCLPLCRIILIPLQTAVLTVRTDRSHSTLTGSGDCYTGHSSLRSSRPCCPFYRIILTSLQPAVLIVMPDLPTPLQLTVLTVMPTHPYSLPTSHADRYAGPSSLHSNRLC